ncbi:uncharacterized protein B0P05DRAFT_547886 [Gilbertella persicaria]|uniref:uncharacterized protein n=1 Tax=Gilbertella persicaria TaxID=101096 RepID=UPI00221F850D|nr:uncharacterized protein B0P05DRAFT_547886 [Gilbertella persicaria]KAI8074260.1 hypothetical protein B0P05DRAFT_547886 [Gilbertella persicaria]
MTLVAIYYNPPFSSVPSTTTSSSKWKRFFSRKHKRLGKSPTTLAAATEKVLCQEEQVKCEDLTAKEFAQIAGIKIKSSSSSSSSSLSDGECDLNTIQPIILSQMTSISTRTATSSKSCHQIWDSDFWQSNTNNNNDNDTLFISRLRSNTLCSKNNNLTVPGVIQKGRFKIVVGQDDCHEPVNQHHHVVLEWKRKRSDSSSTSTTKKK